MPNLMSQFSYRSEKHDLQAKPFVEAIFKKHGYETIEFGTELDKGYRRQMAFQQDEYSRSMRHRPDAYVVHPLYSFVTYDVKAEWQNSGNFAIEADSLYYIQRYVGSIFVLVDMQGNDRSQWAAFCCWAADLSKDEGFKVWVPNRMGYEKDYARMKKMFPAAMITTKQHLSGSGTPYTLVSKRNKLLKPLDEFIQQFLLVSPDLRLDRQLPRQMSLSDQRIEF